jgi:hypothetical protein
MEAVAYVWLIVPYMPWRWMGFIEKSAMGYCWRMPIFIDNMGALMRNGPAAVEILAVKYVVNVSHLPLAAFGNAPFWILNDPLKLDSKF